MKKLIKNIFYIFFPLIIGFLISTLIRNNIDYQVLKQPPLAPPGFLFPIVWTILYTLIGISYFLYKKNTYTDKTEVIIYYLQLFVNALWFLRDLIIFNIISILIKKIVDRFPVATFIAISMIWLIGGASVNILLNSQGIVFFVLGYYVVKYEKRMKMIDKLPITDIFVAYIAAVTIEYVFYLQKRDLINPAHGFSTILGILVLIVISGKIIRHDDTKIPRVISIFASYSFFVYALHDFIQTVLKKIGERILPHHDIMQLLEYLVIPIITCVICVIFAYIIKKTIPRVYALLNGSRQ